MYQVIPSRPKGTFHSKNSPRYVCGVIILLGLLLVSGCKDLTPSFWIGSETWSQNVAEQIKLEAQSLYYSEPLKRAIAMLMAVFIVLGIIHDVVKKEFGTTFGAPIGSVILASFAAFITMILVALGTYGIKGEALVLRFSFLIFCYCLLMILLVLGSAIARLTTDASFFEKMGSKASAVISLIVSGIGAFFTLRDVVSFFNE